MHFGIGEGLKPEQYDFIAEHFDFVTLTAGPLFRNSKGSVELHTAAAAGTTGGSLSRVVGEEKAMFAMLKERK